MMLAHLKFHHLGVAVRNPAIAEQFLCATGYTKENTVFDPLQNVNLIYFTTAGGPSMEVIYPASDGKGPLNAILKDREGIAYHVCYAINDRNRTVAELTDQGLRLAPISPAKPATLFPGNTVSFHNVLGFGLVELLAPILPGE
jgi:methylmalonyl-CoA/ethylmalonyl-CoA epimerase